MITTEKTEAIYKLYPSVTHTQGDVAYDKDENIVAYNEVTVQAYIDANAYKIGRAHV